MKINGQIESIEPNIMKMQTKLVVVTNTAPRHFMDMVGTDLDLDITNHEEKQTDQMRKYYWELVSELARVRKLKNPEVHNQMLRDYSEVVMMADRPVVVEIPDTEEAEKQTLRNKTVHLLPTSEVRFYEDGNYRVHFLLKGSHELNKKQYLRLLEGLIEECQEQGIPTETPDEIERIKALWENK